MNVKMHDMNETEIKDFSEISSQIEALVGARESTPFQNSRKNSLNSQSENPDQGSTG